LQEIKNYVVGLSSTGVTFIPNFVKIGPVVQKLKQDMDGHTDICTHVGR